MNTLAIESFAWSPHLETCAEICVSRAATGDVGLCVLDIPNLDDRDISRTFFGAFGRARRIRIAKKIVRLRGVQIVEPPTLTPAEIAEAEEFSTSELGSFDELLELRFRGASVGFGVGSSLVDRLKQENPTIEQCRANGMVEYLRNAALVFVSAERLVRKYRPLFVLTFNGRFGNARPIALAALRHATKVLYHEGTDHFERYRVDERPPHDFEWWRNSIALAWSEVGGQEGSLAIGREYFERRLSGSSNDQLKHTRHQEPGNLPALDERKRVIFFSQSDEEYAVVDGLVHPLFTNQRECVKWLASHYSHRPDVHFIVRIHPNLLNKSVEDRSWWHSLSGRNLTLIPADSPVDSYQLVRNSDLVLTYCNASVGIEATYLEKPSIVLGDSVYRDIDAAYHPPSLEGLERLLKEDSIPAKPKSNVFPYGYFRDTFGTEFKFYEPETRLTGKLAGVHLGAYPRVFGIAAGLFQRLFSGIRTATGFFAPNRFHGIA